MQQKTYKEYNMCPICGFHQLSYNYNEENTEEYLYCISCDWEETNYI